MQIVLNLPDLTALNLSNTHNLNFRYLTFGDSTGNYGVYIDGACNNIEFYHCVIQMDVSMGYYAYGFYIKIMDPFATISVSSVILSTEENTVFILKGKTQAMGAIIPMLLLIAMCSVMLIIVRIIFIIPI
jgi:hypothetical protein